MNKISVIKSSGITPEDLVKINTFTRRELSEDEVYVFKAVLCDNDIDRDYECFDIKTLSQLSELFVGKTGIFDHNPKAVNQTARIFETELETDKTRKTALGEDYTALIAKVYMLKINDTQNLINQIDGGIKKEISVGCSVKSRVCSICGCEAGECEHVAGKQYEQNLCYFTLKDALDAYEFSFVAVPAQRRAGVIKAFSAEQVVKSLSESDGDITLSKSQIKDILSHFTRLENEAKKGRIFEDELRREVGVELYLSHPEMPRKIINKMVSALDCQSLLSLKKGFEGNCQLKSRRPQKTQENQEFLI